MSDQLPAGWALAPLRDVADVQLGKMLSAAAKSGRGARSYLRNVNVRWHRIAVDDVLQMDFDAREVEKYTLRCGDVLVCEGGEPGRAAVWRDQLPGALYQKALHRVRIRDDALDPVFFVHQLELAAATGVLADRFTGSTIKHLPREVFVEFPLRVPPRAEQRRIVAVLEQQLSELDAAVAGLKRARTNLRRYRAAVQDAAIQEGSERWAWTTFGEHILAIDAGASFRCEERPPRSEEVGVVKVSAVTWGRYNEDESKTVTDRERIDERLMVRPGDFLFSRANTIKLVGACVIADQVTRRVMLSDKILRVRFRGLDPRWALLVLRSAHGRSEIERLATGNQESMRNIGQERIRAIRIPVPSEGEQNEIVTEVESRLAVADRTAAEIDVQLARAVRLRQAILQRALSGRLVPQDTADEPASILLSRTRAGTGARRRSTRTPA